MFGKVKDAYSMQKEARAMQKKMKQITVHGLSDDELVKVTINGLQDITEIDIHDELMSPDSKSDLVKGIKSAMKNAQKNLQKEMMKDFDMDSLKGMFGG